MLLKKKKIRITLTELFFKIKDNDKKNIRKNIRCHLFSILTKKFYRNRVLLKYHLVVLV